jgi:DNA-binding response OmpR family regulator
LLVQNTEHIVTSEKLRCCARGFTEWFVRIHISVLRSRLGREFRGRIVTVKGKGYMYQMVDNPGKQDAFPLKAATPGVARV